MFGFAAGKDRQHAREAKARFIYELLKNRFRWQDAGTEPNKLGFGKTLCHKRISQIVSLCARMLKRTTSMPVDTRWSPRISPSSVASWQLGADRL